MIRYLTVITLAVLAGVGAIILLMARRLTRPLHALATQAREIASGNMDVGSLDLNSRDEVGQVASSVRHMATELARREADRQARLDAEAASQAKSTFLANTSHELRTPLNAILLYCELLKEEVNDRNQPDLTGDLDKIQDAGRHLLDLINTLLDLSKIEAGKMEACLEDSDIPSLLATVMATVEPLVTKKRNQLRLDAAPAILGLHTDARKLRQILQNLLSNASKFTQDGTITLGLHTDGPWACFTVTDTGIGMSTEQLSRIFEEYTQAETSTSARFGGTGLGLTLSRKFAELLGGILEAESEAGKGSRFTLRLPLTPAPEP